MPKTNPIVAPGQIVAKSTDLLAVKFSDIVDDYYTSYNPRKRNKDAEGSWEEWVCLAKDILKIDAHRRISNASSTRKRELLKYVDWTIDKNGRCNSSAMFMKMQERFERLIRDDAHVLLAGRADKTANILLATVAHVFKLVPSDETDLEKI